jgi:hypothetical protein
VLLLTCLGRPKIICPAFPRWAFLASSFSCVGELASRQTPNLEDQDLSRVITPRRVAFTTAKDSRLAPSYPWGRDPYQVLPPRPGGPVARNGRGATPSYCLQESSYPLPSPSLEGQDISCSLGHHLWPVWHGRPYQ